MTWSQIFDKGSNLSWWLGTDKETGCFWSELVDIVHCGHGDDWLLMAAGQLFSPLSPPALRFPRILRQFQHNSRSRSQRIRDTHTGLHHVCLFTSHTSHMLTSHNIHNKYSASLKEPFIVWNLSIYDLWGRMIFLVDRNKNQTRQGQAQEFGIWNLVFGLWTSSMD